MFKTFCGISYLWVTICRTFWLHLTVFESVKSIDLQQYLQSGTKAYFSLFYIDTVGPSTFGSEQEKVRNVEH